MSDKYCGVKLLWSSDYRFWSWFTSHGVYEATNSKGERIFAKIYHLGPLKLFIGVV